MKSGQRPVIAGPSFTTMRTRAVSRQARAKGLQLRKLLPRVLAKGKPDSACHAAVNTRSAVLQRAARAAYQPLGSPCVAIMCRHAPAPATVTPPRVRTTRQRECGI